MSTAHTPQPGPDVSGILSTNWPCSVPAVQVNPAASPVALLGWCWGEVVSLRAVAAAVGAAECDLEADDLNAIFNHRFAPLEVMLKHAINQLHAAEHVKPGGIA
jgi:hypothetical protein